MYLLLFGKFVELFDLACSWIVSKPNHFTLKTVSKPLAQRESSFKLNEVALDCAEVLLDIFKCLPVNTLAHNHQPQQVSIKQHDISLGRVISA